MTLVCCLCTRQIPQTSPVYALDAEWRRRYPTMTGVLACSSCAIRDYYWTCETERGVHRTEHLSAAGHPAHQDIDSWSHIEAHGAHARMVCEYPRSALEQGAETFLRWVAASPTTSRVLGQSRRDLAAVLSQWDGPRVRTH